MMRKNIFLTILFILTIAPCSWAQSTQLPHRFLKVLSSEVFVDTMTRRCFSYIPQAYLLGDCHRVARAMMKQLDMEVYSVVRYRKQKQVTRKTVVVFRKKLDQLLLKIETQKILTAFVKRYRAGEVFNLYRLVESYLVSERATIEFISVLLQDYIQYDPSVGEVGYIKDYNEISLLKYLFEKSSSRNTLIGASNIALLEEVLILLGKEFNQVQNSKLENIDHRRQVFYYPDWMGVDSENTRSYYHFYVMTYLVHQLAEGRRNQRYGLHYKMPFLFNYIYEIYTESKGRYRNLLFDPRKITDENKVADIYLGYRGSLMGAGRLNEALSWEEFKILFQGNLNLDFIL